jgi:hypothetical protein
MSAALTLTAIEQYVRRRLGEPVITVELKKDQIEEIANQALGIYGTWKPIEVWATTPVIPPGQKYTLTAAQFGRGIIEVFRPDLLRQPISLDAFDVFKYHTRLPNLDPGDFYAERIWWKEVRRSAGSDEDWIVENKHDGTADIYITPIPSESYVLSFIIVKDPTFAEVPPTDDDFLKQYVLAMCKETLGLIRRKFGSVQGAETSIDMDGNELVAEGKEEQEKLDEYLTGRGQIIAPIRG